MKRTLLVASAILALTISSPVLAQGTFEHLTDLGGSFSGHNISLAYDGSAFASFRTYWSESTGYVTTADGVFSSITGNGLKVVGTLNDPSIGADNAAVWDPATDTWTFVDPMPGGGVCGSFMSGYAGNFDGTMVTGLAWRDPCDGVAFLWTEGVGTVDLGRNDDEDRSSRGSDISDDGTTVGGFFENNACGRRNAIWVNGGPVEFPLGEDSCGEVYGVNTDGTMLCGLAPGAGFVQEAYFYDSTIGFVPIGTLPSNPNDGSIALGVADNGWVVGQNGTPFFSFLEGWIWTPEDGLMPFGDFLDLRGIVYPDGAFFTSCSDISADGNTIVGSWVPEGGFLAEAFKVTLGPPVAAFMADFQAVNLDGAVALSFAINGDATANDFELVAELGGNSWTVSVTGSGSAFEARDSSANLAQGGTVTYSLYFNSEAGNTLVQTKSVNLPAVMTKLIGASPNPFNPLTTVFITLGSTQEVKVSVYDLAGRRIAELANGVLPSGRHALEWNGTDFSGRSVASSTYSIHMETANGIQTEKMSLVR